jgi:hypothetical protein
MVANTKARLRKSLLFLGAVLVHSLIFWALSHIVVFPATDDVDDSVFQKVKILLPPQPVVEAPQPAVPVPPLDLAGDSGGGKASDLSQIKVITSFHNNTFLVKAMDSYVRNNTHLTIPVLAKADGDGQGNGAGNGNGDGAGNGTGAEAGDGSRIGLFSNDISADEKLAFVIEQGPFVFDAHYLSAFLSRKRQPYTNAGLIVACTSEEKTVSDSKPWAPLAGKTYTVDPQDEQIIGNNEPEVRPPDVFSNDLYEGIHWAIDHRYSAVILISGFDQGDSPEVTQSAISAMRAARIHFFVISVHKEPYDGLLDYATESGGKGVTTSSTGGDPYQSPDWMLTTKIITRAGAIAPPPAWGIFGAE